MEEAAKVIGGVAGELVFFMRSFLLGFLMRLGYEPIIFFLRLFLKYFLVRIGLIQVIM